MTTAEAAKRFNDADERLERLVLASQDQELINALVECRIAMVRWWESLREKQSVR